MNKTRQADGWLASWWRREMSGPRMFPFEQMEVYQRALQFTEAVCDIANLADERSRPSDVVTADHLRRAALAVLSVAEETDDRSDRQHDRAWDCLEQAKVAICRCVALLQLFAAQGRVDADLYSWCYDECLALSEMIDQLIAQAEPLAACGQRVVSR